MSKSDYYYIFDIIYGINIHGISHYVGSTFLVKKLFIKYKYIFSVLHGINFLYLKYIMYVYGINIIYMV